MRGLETELDPELAAFLEGRGAERQLSPEVRARVLARSRASVSGDRAFMPARPVERRRAAPVLVWRRFRLARVALAAAIVLGLAGAAGALAALYQRGLLGSPGPAVGSSSGTQPSAPMHAPPPVSVEAPAVVVSQPAVATKPVRVARDFRPSSGEVELVERIHLACARHDYTVALAMIQEHARRFPRGALAEEREALRIESLAGLGSTDEARRRAAVYAARFPRSVLLPRVKEAVKETAP